MTMKNFINIHILTSHSPSCINRDQHGMPKSTFVGGVKRTRISSQCLNRAVRHSPYFKEHISNPSIRTKNISLLYDECYKKIDVDNDIIKTVIDTVSGIKNSAKKSNKKEKKENTEETSKQEENVSSASVIAWAIDEIEAYCKLYIQLKNEFSDQKLFEKAWATEVKNIKFKEHYDGKDIALSGRLITSGLLTSIDAAISVAHPFTTHSQKTDFDWFTAVDDLNMKYGTGGSAHLDTQHFNAGVFYKYISMNLSQFQNNISDSSREYALEIATHLMHMYATITPSGKQTSFAAYNPADFIMVTIGTTPISLANAFERPVLSDEHNGYLSPSVNRILTYKENLFTKYNLDDTCAYFFTGDDIHSGVNTTERKDDLNQLKHWIKGDGK